MVQNVSGFGFRARLVASSTYPRGISLTQWADDADPFDTPEIQVADKKMGLNGELVVWSVASAIEIKLAVVPGSDDDRALAILLEANRVGQGKTSAQDDITLTAIYPQQNDLTLTSGFITNGPVGSSIASAGRLKSKVYTFAFENRSGAPA
jgi:hypothetical protein